MTHVPATQRRGQIGESLAALYLELEGYRILARNVRQGHLEIDLVARRGAVVAFVEVRLRSSRAWGRPEESVGRRKGRNVRYAAERLFSQLDIPAACRPRCDVIAVERRRLGLELRHLPGWIG